MKQFKSYSLNRQTHRLTDRQTDRRTDRHDRKHYLPAFAGGNNLDLITCKQLRTVIAPTDATCGRKSMGGLILLGYLTMI